MIRRRLLMLMLMVIIACELVYSQNGSVMKVNDPSALGATDSVDWLLAGSNGTDLLSGFIVTSPTGITVKSTFAEPFEEILIPWLFDGSFFWNGGPLSESGLDANVGGPTMFSFGTPISGAGLFIQVEHIDFPGPFTASISAYSDTTLLGTVSEDGNSLGPQIFLGVISASANITSIIVNTTTGSYGMGTLRLRDGCQVRVFPFADGPISRDGHLTSMKAAFTPSSGLKLREAATACGFQGFEWQQVITNLPCPSPFDANLGPENKCSDGFLKTPPMLNDPPLGGYTFPVEYLSNPSNFSFPFYYPSDIAIFEQNSPGPSTFCVAGKDCRSGNVCVGTECTPLVSVDGKTLSFHDAPGNVCLPGADPVANRLGCSGKTAAPGSFMAFTTALVGILPDGSPSSPLAEWTWRDTYNFTSGGISTTLNSIPVDLGGTGGITITSINGVLQSPPVITCRASPSILWPPNAKSISVTISGKIAAGTSTVIPSASIFNVIDSQAKVQSSGTVMIQPDGTYIFAIPLIADRDGDNKEGRRYTIAVNGRDNIGNVGSCSTFVTVPHDQRH